MITNEEVRSEFGGVLIPPGTRLNRKLIDQLKETEIKEIQIKTAAVIEAEKDKKVIAKEKYEKSLDDFSEAYKKAYYMKKVDFRTVRSLTEEAMEISQYLDLEDILKITRDIDMYTYSHSLHVGILAHKFGNWLNLTENKICNLTTSALLHDIGKSRIKKEIITRPAPLSPEEYEEVKKHSEYGYKLLKKSNRFSKSIMAGVLTHHERYHGGGYPLGLKKEEIPLFGRIIAICDTFDALTTDRPYQKAVSPFTAVKIMEEDFDSFDHRLKMLFIEKIPYSLIGDRVVLSNDQLARVVFINPSHPESPIVKTEDEYLDLSSQSELSIKKLLRDLEQMEEMMEEAEQN
ncbi:HD-GYP domain-containing protein [Halanaerobium saccharolyticum]|jgi:HD-GYP domain-containing protein (c-di-GMP phosphodiesterase class II)|uniref:HD-GYP domain-containing protein (C-di-GMP phosphodiesterase class II) n=1 Tax=Halanaerobium saccharolyticum TaxID=43595 RepID=A0A2T5RST7_9FIRM|nr:HD-GYP domain-containing protein [Halanaerobium saccharolyticum]PTW03411.1 HD-GYP domain-containing protein (c-di-GMP phosphodiesterase class II) [Halanaerobium saccharolyticum]PUU92819.1 MAG: metal dependent phosphohydrolase [Halanaerobium sp.]